MLTAITMRFLDLDLDFFQNYCRNGYNGIASRPAYKPWSISNVRHFLEYRCGLSLDAPVQGRTVESHDGVLDFWHMLIESSKLRVPFEVTHIDAHPDLWVGAGFYLKSGFLHFDLECGRNMLERKQVHSGNYLTFAIVYGWISSLLWISLRKHFRELPKWDGDARLGLMLSKKREDKRYAIRNLPRIEKEHHILFKTLHWHKFRTREPFDYIALSRSPNFTPPESSELITVVEEYMKQI